MIYTVTLNPALDYYCTVETLNLGETNRCITESLIGGGKGINVSLMLAQLGVPTTALGFAAGFTGEELIRQLQDQSVNADFIRCAQGQTRINVKINSGVETEINGRGPEVSAAEREALLDRIRRIQPGDTLVLSGNVPPTLPESIYEQILAELPASSIRVVVDAEGALLRDTLRFHPFLIKPNLAELRQLVANPQAPVSDQIQELRRQGRGISSCRWGRKVQFSLQRRVAFIGSIRCRGRPSAPLELAIPWSRAFWLRLKILPARWKTVCAGRPPAVPQRRSAAESPGENRSKPCWIRFGSKVKHNFGKIKKFFHGDSRV